GLVAGNQNHALSAVARGGFGHQAGAGHVVLHRLARIGFHERHVLVRGGVEDDIGLHLREDRVQAALVGDIADDGMDGGGQAAIVQAVDHRVEVVLVALVEHQLRGIERGDLRAQLGANRSASAGDEHASTGEQRADGGRVEADGGALEQVFDGEVADVSDVHAIAGDAEGWRSGDVELKWFEQHQQAAQLGGADGGSRDQHFARLHGADDSRQVLPRSEHGDTVDVLAFLAAVFVDESNRLVAIAGMPFHVADDHLADVAGADDQDAPPAAREHGLRQHASDQAHAAEQENQQQRVDDEDRSRIRVHLPDDVDERVPGDGADGDRTADAAEIPQARVAPQ